jgi:hypothetical protein
VSICSCYLQLSMGDGSELWKSSFCRTRGLPPAGTSPLLSLTNGSTSLDFQCTQAGMDNLFPITAINFKRSAPSGAHKCTLECLTMSRDLPTNLVHEQRALLMTSNNFQSPREVRKYGTLRKARARARRCFSPPLSFTPLSPTIVS